MIQLFLAGGLGIPYCTLAFSTKEYLKIAGMGIGQRELANNTC